MRQIRCYNQSDANYRNRQKVQEAQFAISWKHTKNGIDSPCPLPSALPPALHSQYQGL